ncbi:30S ribosomal subunit protein S21 [Candidatus Kuenenia stuttgartiensis]|jgi:small subunit ribosomal protein S21|uniref:Small ribosomal subunit protein bS21 n=1 Tax=Kuenenia stuttgartiensis TaxID=174633 RepID=Q1PZT1_KUEST|nr:MULTISPECIES: 30S ribosomal protein S21 [Kuenenia]MBE7546639.1 30S ribosomal protein S21 [Planctomycetia bacterium]MBW7942587.1 30S ribosomal protein S21 [Candidatus Kuenenia stuttgartiensis]MBZ0191010.1 30S ribosomal protein S21 [Candidatus Kuenenia stuttgartiensis]MCF6151217.1 30S ribosomal protein S21 [Candidatus Kuenenia stuttgartiensis]MCL4726045.1 30S ribosomal protein S21 [Candidatus Kuenenia stuttgartiensis]
MAKILITSDENIRDALRRFKKMCDKEGIINQSKRIAYFEKPSEKKRREESRRIKNIKRAQKLGISGQTVVARTSFTRSGRNN